MALIELAQPIEIGTLAECVVLAVPLRSRSRKPSPSLNCLYAMRRRDFLVETSSLIASLVTGIARQGELGGRPATQSRKDNIFGVGKESRVDYASLLGQHDIVYLSPVGEGTEGLPIGNG